MVAKMTNVLDDLLNYRGPRDAITGYILALLPGFFHFSLPLSGFLTGALFAARFRQTHEFTAVWASGIPVGRVTRPPIIFLLLSVPAVLYFQDRLLPQANSKAAELYRRLTGSAEQQGTAQSGPLNLHLPGISLFIPAFNFQTLKGNQVILQRKSAEGNHVSHICAGFERHNAVVRMLNCRSYSVAPGYKTAGFEEQASIEVNDPALTEALSFRPQLADESNFSSLASALRYNSLRGLKNDSVWTEIFSRLAFAFILPLAAGVGFLTGLRFTGGGLALVLGVSLLFAAIYYTLLFTLRALGNTGTVPPVVAAALPDTLLAIFGWKLARRFGI